MTSCHMNDLCITGTYQWESRNYKWQVDSPETGTFMRSICVFLVVSPNEMLNKQLGGKLNETPQRRHAML